MYKHPVYQHISGVNFLQSAHCLCNNVIRKWLQVVVHGIFPSPQPCYTIEFGNVIAIHLPNGRLHANVPKWVCQQWLDTQQHLWYSQCQAPIVMYWIKSNITVSTDIWMKDFCNETNNRWLHWIATMIQYTLYLKNQKSHSTKGVENDASARSPI